MDSPVLNLLKWLRTSDKFVLSDKIEVRDIPNEGRGIILCNGEVRRNEVVISVPSDYQINFYTVLHHISLLNPRIIGDEHADYPDNDDDANPQRDLRYKVYDQFTRQFLLELSSFQLISLYILIEWILLPEWTNNEIRSFWQPFFDVWPTVDDLKSIPALWNCSAQSKYKNLLELLPSSSKNHMSRISKLIDSDWEKISPSILSLLTKFPIDSVDIDSIYEKFLHVYFIINSRCLYANIDIKSDDVASQFTLVPFVDFINHSDQMDTYCYPKINYMEKNGSGIGQFVIRGGPYTYKVLNEEILFSYGPHCNDFLLNEYGFTMIKNQWNFIDISKTLCDLFAKDQKMVEYLKTNDYWGDYTINEEGISYRTFVALSLYSTNDYKRLDKLISGYISEDFFANKIKGDLILILQNQLDMCYEILSNIDNMEDLNQNDFCVFNVTNIYKNYVDILRNARETVH